MSCDEHIIEEWTDKNGDVYRLDPDAPEGVVRYNLVEKAKKSKAKKSLEILRSGQKNKATSS